MEEGPWTISAAETPHDPSSYSLYIKSECCAVLPIMRDLPLPWLCMSALARVDASLDLVP